MPTKKELESELKKKNKMLKSLKKVFKEIDDALNLWGYEGMGGPTRSDQVEAIEDIVDVKVVKELLGKKMTKREWEKEMMKKMKPKPKKRK